MAFRRLPQAPAGTHPCYLCRLTKEECLLAEHCMTIFSADQATHLLRTFNDLDSIRYQLKSAVDETSKKEVLLKMERLSIKPEPVRHHALTASRTLLPPSPTPTHPHPHPPPTPTPSTHTHTRLAPHALTVWFRDAAAPGAWMHAIGRSVLFRCLPRLWSGDHSIACAWSAVPRAGS